MLPVFSFAVTITADAVRVTAGVPDGAEACLNDLERMTSRCLGPIL